MTANTPQRQEIESFKISRTLHEKIIQMFSYKPEQEKALIFLWQLERKTRVTAKKKGNTARQYAPTRLCSKILERTYGRTDFIRRMVASDIVRQSGGYSVKHHISKSYQINPALLPCTPGASPMVTVCSTENQSRRILARIAKHSDTDTLVNKWSEADPTISREYKNTKALMRKHFPGKKIWFTRGSRGGRVYSALNCQTRDTKKMLPGVQFDQANGWLSNMWAMYPHRRTQTPPPNPPTPELKNDLRRFLSDPRPSLGPHERVFTWLLGFNPGFARWLNAHRQHPTFPTWERATRFETDLFRNRVYSHLPKSALWFSEGDGFWIEHKYASLAETLITKAISDLGLTGVIEYTKDKNK